MEPIKQTVENNLDSFAFQIISHGGVQTATVAGIHSWIHFKCRLLEGLAEIGCISKVAFSLNSCLSDLLRPKIKNGF